MALREVGRVGRMFVSVFLRQSYCTPLAGLGLAQESLELRENYLPLPGIKGVHMAPIPTPLFFFVGGRGLLCSTGWPRTFNPAQASLGLLRVAKAGLLMLDHDG